ncbi:MAG: hypothetical protein E7386_10240 [Ruminococcaceae bacterium]|nr:hypothetical protein [Oscillospiraceae bacterium]
MADNQNIMVPEVNTEAAQENVNAVSQAVAVKASNKEFEGLSERDLLVELLKEQRKASKRSLITAISLVIICVAFAGSLLIIVPKIVSTLNNAYKAIDSIQTVVANADKALSSVEQSLDGIDEMVKNVDKVVTDNSDAVTKTVEKVSNIDIATLNKSIKDLSEIIAPLAKFFRR